MTEAQQKQFFIELLEMFIKDFRLDGEEYKLAQRLLELINE